MHIAEGAGTSGARRQIEAAGPVMNWMNADNIVDVDFIEDESGTAQVHPRHFCETLLAECIRLGVEVVQDRAGRVERVAAGSGGSNSNNSKPTVAVVCDGDHRVDFDKLVLCAGPWTGQVAKQLLSLNLAVHELPGHSFVMTTKEPLPALAGFASATGRDGSVTTTPEWFTRPDGTIYIAGENCDCMIAQAKGMLLCFSDRTTRTLFCFSLFPSNSRRAASTRNCERQDQRGLTRASCGRMSAHLAATRYQ